MERSLPALQHALARERREGSMTIRRVSLAILVVASAGCVGTTGDAPPPLNGSTNPGAGPPSSPGGGGYYGGSGPAPSPAPPGTAGGNIGVTPGGAKDIGYARELIRTGKVPDPSAITVEGLLSEHDIPVEGGACQGLLCSRPALGVARFLASKKLEHFVQVGFLSGFERDTFRRPPIDILVLIDHSGAMASDQRETNAAVVSLIGKMREDDRLGVMIFNDSVQTLAPIGPVTDPAALKAKVAAVQPTGGANIVPAMEAAYRALDAIPSSPTRMRRLMIFSCGYPSVANSPQDPVSQLVLGNAQKRIGLSFFGVLLGWDAALAKLLGQARGGAYYYLQDLTKIERVFDADFDLMVTPILYDLKLAVDPGASFEVVKLYGMPGDDPPAAGMTVKPDPGQGQTGGAFLSSRKGAIVAHLRVKEGASRAGAVGTVTLKYEPEPALGFGDSPIEQRAEIADVATPNETGAFQGTGVRKAVALVNQATRMKAACEAYQKNDKETARTILAELRDYLEAEAKALDDPGLRDEVKLVAALLANVGP
jgi:Ca-activated chloride channel family protein